MKKLIFILILFCSYCCFCQSLNALNEEPTDYLYSSNIRFQKVTTIKSLYFEFNKSILNENSIAALNTILTVMNDNPEMKISLNSYSDILETNNNLSLKRAIAAKKYLVKNGVLTNRLIVNDFGNTKQLSEVNAGHYERRVEFEIE